MADPATRLHTYAEYLLAEEGSAVKHEYYQGHLLAMAGGTVEHSLLKTNLTGLFVAALRGRPCRAFDADLRTRVEASDLTTYPDLAVICGPIARSAIDRNALVNPTLLVEVLSPSTAVYDLGEKFRHYTAIPSLRAYLVVDSSAVGVHLYERDGDRWTVRLFGAGDVVPIGCLEIDLAVDVVYDGWAEVVAAEAAERHAP